MTTAPKRIMFVTDSLFAGESGRGATTTTKAVADRLIELGHEVRFLAPAPGLVRYRNSDVIRLNPLIKPGTQVRSAIETWRPDVLHVTTPGRLGRKALKHARAHAVPTVTVEQHPIAAVEAEYWRAKVADRTDALFTTSQWMVERLAGLEIAAHLWTPGVDGHAFSPTLRDEHLHDTWARAKHDPRVVVGFAGRLANRHGVRHLVELNNVPGIRPVIIGDGPQEAWLRQRVADAKMVGALRTGDLAVALASLDVLVHPGEDETCCHTLREAAASGVPIVAPRAGGAADLVDHLETGLQYEPGRPGALADAVAAVAADPQRALLGAAGRERVIARDWSTAVDELLARYPVPVLTGSSARVA